MISICILCPDDKVIEARKIGKHLSKNQILNIAVSKDGSLPIEYWFCSMVVSDENLKTINDLDPNSDLIIEESNPISFLKNKNLKIINKNEILRQSKNKK